MTILTIDLGTQSVRAAFVNKIGHIDSITQLKQEVDSPYDGWAQQQPKKWWNLTKRAIQQLLEKTKIEAKSIQGIGVCGQMHGPVGIDGNGEITTKWTQIWCDKRCENICDLIKKDYDEQD
ncbi:MAG: xylulokinase, partial [Candidatus Lokiarchaeota archaeon]|nr:xylulokinase [Candidatus Lokiarchaeota archaeon]MBD3340965.1 xylulokinase [Candidatus Lokiarchaeota archaeon]